MLHVTSYIFILLIYNNPPSFVVPIYNIVLPKRKCYKMILINDFNKKKTFIKFLLKDFYFYYIPLKYSL